MAILKILQFPDKRLKQVAKPVTEFDDRIQQIIDDMFETHYAADNCAALAATQLDIVDPPMITVIDYSENRDQPLCLVNPEITHLDGEQFEYEGCMSVGVNTDDRAYEKVKRAMKIKVKALDRHGNPLEFEAEGFKAKCIQHEVDHLHGKLFLDRLPNTKRTKIVQCILKK